MFDEIHPKDEARIRLAVWREVGQWLGYAAAEFVADETTKAYLEHVGSCVRDEGERRYSVKAGFTPALAEG